MWCALKAKASVTRRRGLTTQTEMSLATAWIVQGYHTVLIWVVACSTDVVRPLQSTGRRSCCTCDGQRTSPCWLSRVGEHWHQRRAGSRRWGHAKYIRHAGKCGRLRARFTAHSRQFWVWLASMRTVNEVYAVPSRRPISFCSCRPRLLFHMFLSIFTAVVISTGRRLWGQPKGSVRASRAPETQIGYWLSLLLNYTGCAARKKISPVYLMYLALPVVG